jgi:hypothetical protein
LGKPVARVEEMIIDEGVLGKNKIREKKDAMRVEITKIEKDRKMRPVGERRSDLYQPVGSREYGDKERAVLRTFIKDPREVEKKERARAARVQQFVDVMGHDGVKVEYGELSFDSVALYAAKLVSRGFKSVYHYIGPG